MVQRGIHRKADICQTDNNIHSKLGTFFYSVVIHTWKYNIQDNKRLTKIKTTIKCQLLNLMFWFFHFLHSNVPDSKCHKQK